MRKGLPKASPVSNSKQGLETDIRTVTATNAAQSGHEGCECGGRIAETLRCPADALLSRRPSDKFCG
jgi:hypothetical protein